MWIFIGIFLRWLKKLKFLKSMYRPWEILKMIIVILIYIEVKEWIFRESLFVNKGKKRGTIMGYDGETFGFRQMIPCDE